jgi:hypothetical protein
LYYRNTARPKSANYRAISDRKSYRNISSSADNIKRRIDKQKSSSCSSSTESSNSIRVGTPFLSQYYANKAIKEAEYYITGM